MIVLTEEECVAPRGTTAVHWYVRVGDSWRAAGKVEGARVELDKNPGPGVVWRRHTHIELPRGTRVLRVASAPRELTRSPIEHLTRTRSSPRRTRERLYSIGPHGELVPEVTRARPGPS